MLGWHQSRMPIGIRRYTIAKTSFKVIKVALMKQIDFGHLHIYLFGALFIGLLLGVDGRQTMMAADQPLYAVISRGEAAGPYQAFPDVCRLPTGDLACVFYAGYGHVSLPNAEWPRGGRICLVQSS